jgi:hypothetical protein
MVDKTRHKWKITDMWNLWLASYCSMFLTSTFPSVVGYRNFSNVSNGHNSENKNLSVKRVPTGI